MGKTVTPRGIALFLDEAVCGQRELFLRTPPSGLAARLSDEIDLHHARYLRRGSATS
jgi:hypothetical protein